MADARPQVTPGGLIHRAPYDTATKAVLKAAVAGAKAAVENDDELMLQSVDVVWAVPINFDDQGNEFVNTAEPGSQPAQVTARFVRIPVPSDKKS